MHGCLLGEEMRKCGPWGIKKVPMVTDQNPPNRSTVHLVNPRGFSETNRHVSAHISAMVLEADHPSTLLASDASAYLVREEQ